MDNGQSSASSVPLPSTPVEGQPQPLAPSPLPSKLPTLVLPDLVRWLLGIIAIVLLALGCFLAVWQETHTGQGTSGAGAGIGTAAVFAAGLLAAVGAINGALPASIKVGDVQLQLQAAQQRTADAAANLVAAKNPAKSLQELPILKENPSLEVPFQQINAARQAQPEEWDAKINQGEVPVFAGFVGQ
jgi:hypothetical protein